MRERERKWGKHSGTEINAAAAARRPLDAPLQMMEGGRGVVVFGCWLFARDKLHFQRADISPCSFRESRTGEAQCACASNLADKRFPFRGHLFRFPSRSSSSTFAARPPFSPAKTSITAFPFFTPIASSLALCSRSPFTLCSLFFPSLNVEQHELCHINGGRARLCYLWAWEGDGLGRPQIEEGGRKEGGEGRIISDEG